MITTSDMLSSGCFLQCSGLFRPDITKNKHLVQESCEHGFILLTVKFVGRPVKKKVVFTQQKGVLGVHVRTFDCWVDVGEYIYTVS